MAETTLLPKGGQTKLQNRIDAIMYNIDLLYERLNPKFPKFHRKRPDGEIAEDYAMLEWCFTQLQRTESGSIHFMQKCVLDDSSFFKTEFAKKWGLDEKSEICKLLDELKPESTTQLLRPSFMESDQLTSFTLPYTENNTRKSEEIVIELISFMRLKYTYHLDRSKASTVRR